MRILNFVLMDSDYDRVKNLEATLLREFGYEIDLRVITLEEYRDLFFETMPEIDILMTTPDFYGDYLLDHEIAHTLLLVPGESQQLFSELPVTVMAQEEHDSVIRTIREMMKQQETSEAASREAQVQAASLSAAVVSVFSPAGGSGKSLTAWGLARKLKMLDQRPLIIGCDSIQSFSCFLDDVKYAEEILPLQLRNPGDGTAQALLRNVIPGEVSYLAPFTGPVASEGLGFEEWTYALRLLKNCGRFDYIILDVGSHIDELAEQMLKLSDTIILLMEDDPVTVRKVRRLLGFGDFFPEKQILSVVNLYHSDSVLMADDTIFGSLNPYASYELAWEDPIFYRLALELL